MKKNNAILASWQQLFATLPTSPFKLAGFANIKLKASISAPLRGVQVGRISERKNQVGNKLTSGSLRIFSDFEVTPSDTLSPTGRERIPMGISLIPTGRRVDASRLQGVCHG